MNGTEEKKAELVVTFVDDPAADDLLDEVKFEYASTEAHENMCGPLQVVYYALIREYGRIHETTPSEAATTLFFGGMALMGEIDD